MSEAELVPVTCPVCKGINLTTKREGLVLKKTIYDSLNLRFEHGDLQQPHIYCQESWRGLLQCTEPPGGTRV